MWEGLLRWVILNLPFMDPLRWFHLLWSFSCYCHAHSVGEKSEYHLPPPQVLEIRVKMGKQIFQGASFISSDIKSCRLMRKESEWANGNNKVKIVGRVATTRHICYRYRSAASAWMNKGGSLLPSYVGSNQKHGNWTWVQLLFSHSWYTCPKPLIQDLVAIFRPFFIPSLK